ncbi:hypothetical protein NFI96_026850 [Prochilodus magdalenae]|nr:hypothetical protein NFI96_026850 [Prochilodus magdalenae]
MESCALDPRSRNMRGWVTLVPLNSDGRVQKQEILQCTKVFQQKQPYLSFHGFPADGEQKKKSLRAVRRDEAVNFVIRRGSTIVCSRHFTAADYIEGSSWLKPGAVPTRFQWNNFYVPLISCQRLKEQALAGE